MRNIEEIILVAFIFILGVFALYTIVSGVSNSNSNLDDESAAIVENYNEFYSEVKSNSSVSFDGDEYQEQASNTGVDAFYRSVSEAKTTSDKFKTMKNVFWGFPKALIASIPLVPYESINYILGIIYGLIGIFSFIAIFKMWFGGNTSN